MLHPAVSLEHNAEVDCYLEPEQHLQFGEVFLSLPMLFASFDVAQHGMVLLQSPEPEPPSSAAEYSAGGRRSRQSRCPQPARPRTAGPTATSARLPSFKLF